jgi:hypothetical protein
MSASLDNLLRPSTIQVIRTAGLHRIVGEIAGVGDLDVGKVAGLIGARAFVRRKTARLVAGGILSMAAAQGERLSAAGEERIRNTVSPARGAR